MKRMINRTVFQAFCLLAGLGTAAQTPSGTNATPEQPASQPSLLQTNVLAGLNPALGPVLTNQLGSPVATQTGVLPAMTGMTGPTSPGSGVIGSPLMGTGSFGGGSAFGGGNVAPSGGFLRWGPFDFHPYVAYSLLSESGIGSEPGQHNGTIVNTISEGVTVNLGTRWSLNYGASTAFYSEAGYTDNTSQHISLQGSASYKDWIFGLGQSYSETSEPLVETGTQTEETAYGTSLSVSRQLGSKWSFSLGANQSFRFTSQFDNVEAWSGSGGVNYQLLPQISVGLSVNGGYDVIRPGNDMQSEEVQGVIGFHPGQKFTLSLSGGVEDQQFVGTDVPALATPVFAASAGYALFQSTTITLNAARTATPSFFTNQDSVSTVLSLGIQQILTRKLSLSLIGSYRVTSFTSIEPGPLPSDYSGTAPASSLSVVRSDTTTTVQTSLHYGFTQRLSGSAFYSFSQNSSSQGDFAFSSSQIGMQLSYSY
jgi:hypothetical protein